MNKPSNIFGIVFDFFLPKNKLDIEIESVTNDELSRRLAQNNKINDYTYTLFSYKDELIKNMIWSIKYRRNRNTAKIFAFMIYDFIVEEFSDLSVYSDFQDPILIPVPTSKEHLRKRGVNHTELLAKEFCIIASTGFCVLRTDILKKIKNTKSQTSLERTARLANIIGSFGIHRSEVIKNRNVILLDDVTTTGATLNEARNILLNAGAKKVVCITIAH